MSYAAACVEMNSIAQQARPKPNGHTRSLRPQLTAFSRVVVKMPGAPDLLCVLIANFPCPQLFAARRLDWCRVVVNSLAEAFHCALSHVGHVTAALSHLIHGVPHHSRHYLGNGPDDEGDGESTCQSAHKSGPYITSSNGVPAFHLCLLHYLRAVSKSIYVILRPPLRSAHALPKGARSVEARPPRMRIVNQSGIRYRITFWSTYHLTKIDRRMPVSA